MHVLTASARNHTRSLGLGLCLTVLVWAGCSDDPTTSAVSPTTPTSPKTVRFAYLPNTFSNNISAYTIDPRNGSQRVISAEFLRSIGSEGRLLRA